MLYKLQSKINNRYNERFTQSSMNDFLRKEIASELSYKLASTLTFKRTPTENPEFDYVDVDVNIIDSEIFKEILNNLKNLRLKRPDLEYELNAIFDLLHK